MRTVEIDRGQRIATMEDVSTIKDPTEREFAGFLLDRKPGFIVIHEPKMFGYTSKRGRMNSTVPDFAMVNPNNGNAYFFELTRSPKPRRYIDHGTHEFRTSQDPKERQRRVMSKGAEGRYYHVFYGDDLRRLQIKFPQYNFFKSINSSNGNGSRKKRGNNI